MTAKAIIEAIKAGDLNQIESFVEQNETLAEVSSPEGLTLVMLAAYYGKMDIAEFLGSHKKELTAFEAATLGKSQRLIQLLNEDPGILNTFSSDGFTLLGLASFFGREDMVRLLISEGADVNIPSNNGMNVAPIHSAVARQAIPTVEILIKNGANVNAVQQKGVTPLHSAAHNGNVALVEMLVENGANTKTKMEDGKAAADMAREAGFEDLAKKLSN